MIKKYWNILLIKMATLNVKLFSDLKLGKKVIFKRVPEILIHKTASITIEDNVVINSSNYGYHISMFSKCKLYADRPNAIIEIGKNSRIHGTCIHAFKKIIIGENCLIAANTQIIDGSGHKLSFENTSDRINTKDFGETIIIHNNVWIAANCFILGGTTIGEGAVISANSVVKGIIPSNCIFGGNPAKLIRQY